MKIPTPNRKTVIKLYQAINDGINQGCKWDLALISKICNRDVCFDELDGIDEDTISESFVERLSFGRPPKYEKFDKASFVSLLSDVYNNKFSQAQHDWIIEMIEIMYGLPSGYIMDKIYQEDAPVDEIWDNVQLFRPILL